MTVQLRHWRAWLLSFTVVAGAFAYAAAQQTVLVLPAPKAALPPSVWYVDPATYGVVGDGHTDDTAAWQLTIDTAKDGDCILVPPHLCSLISAPLNLYSRSGLTFWNPSRPDTRAQKQRGGEFVWVGPGVGPIFNVNYSRIITFDGIAFSLDNAPATTCAVSFDQAPVTGAPAPLYNTTHCRILRSVFIPTKTPLPTGTLPAGVVQISMVARQNCDDIEISDCKFNSVGGAGSSDGIRIANSLNAKGYLFSRNGFLGFSTAINMDAGCMMVRDCGGANNGTDVRVGVPGGPILLEGLNFEQSCQVYNGRKGYCLDLAGGNCPYTVISCRWSNVFASPFFNFNNSSQIGLLGNYLYAAQALNAVAYGQNQNGHLMRNVNRWSNVTVNDYRWLAVDRGAGEWEY